MQRAIAVIVTVVWTASAVHAMLTGDGSVFMYASGVMVIAASWLFTLKGFELVRRNDNG